MFVVEVGAVLTTIELVHDTMRTWRTLALACRLPYGCGSPCCSRISRRHGGGTREGAGGDSAQGASGNRSTPGAREGRSMRYPSSKLRSGDIVVVRLGVHSGRRRGHQKGVASVDESAITGESAPVIRESGGDRSASNRRDARAFRRNQDTHHFQSRRNVSGPHDPSCRGTPRDRKHQNETR